MAAIIPLLLVVSVLVSQGHTQLTQIQLADETLTYLTNDLIGKTITIPKFWFDTLETCYVVFPNGLLYEAYPNNNMNTQNIFFLQAVQPFLSCAIGFINIGVEDGGTYELLSLVRHTDDSQTLTRQRFHLIVREIEPWNAPAENLM